MAITASISITPGSMNIAGNYTPVTFAIKVSWTYGSYDHYENSVTWTIDGKNYNFTRGKINPNRTTTGSQTLITKKVNIYHRSDGTKSVSSSCSIPTASSSGTVKASNSKTLTTIPRATTPVIKNAEGSSVVSSAAVGSVIRIDVTGKASSGFTHDITYKLGNTSGTIYTGLQSYLNWTVPESLANYLPTSTPGTMTITCKTKNGSTTVGTKSISLKSKR